MGEGVLQAICQLESIYIAQPELNIGVHHQLGQPQNLSAQMESIAKPRLLPLLGGQGLDWLQVEVVVQMQVVEILAMNQQIEHVVALPADLQGTKPKVKACNVVCVHTLQDQRQARAVKLRNYRRSCVTYSCMRRRHRLQPRGDALS